MKGWSATKFSGRDSGAPEYDIMSVDEEWGGHGDAVHAFHHFKWGDACVEVKGSAVEKRKNYDWLVAHAKKHDAVLHFGQCDHAKWSKDVWHKDIGHAVITIWA